MNDETVVNRRSFFDPSLFLGSVMVGTVAGAAAGMVAGLAARGAMRSVAILSGQTPAFSVGGTLFIIGLGALVGIGIGLIFAFTYPVWSGTASRKALTLGLVLALLIALPFLFLDLGGELALVAGWMAALLFAPIPLIYGLVLGQVAGRLIPRELERSVPSPAFLRTAGMLTAAGGLAGALIELFLAIAFPAARLVGASASQIVGGAAGAAIVLAMIAGITGLIRSEAAGDSRLIKAGLGFALLTAMLLGIGGIFTGMSSIELHGLVRMFSRLESDRNLILPVSAVIGSLLALAAGGAAVLKGRRWRGWRAYAPLAVGLVPLLSVLLLHPALFPSLAGLSAFGRIQLGHWVGAANSLAWLSLGLALRAEAE